MSDTQDTRNEAHTAPPEDHGQNGQHEPASELDALNELENARTQLRNAQEQLEAAHKRMAAAEKGMQTYRPQGLTGAVDQGGHENEEDKQPDEGAAEEESPKIKKEPQKEENASYGFLNACFDGFARLGPISLCIFMACMAWMIFLPGHNLYYCPAEIDPLSAFLRMSATASWIAPCGIENGAFTQAQWPLFTWYIALLGWIPGLVSSGWLLPVAAFSATLFAVFAVWCLVIGTGFGFRAAMAAAMILLCAPIFAPLPHFVGPATLAAGLMLFALLFFYRGWKAPHSWIWLPLAFALTALAGLAGGVLPFVTPLVASICFLIWRGTFSRFYHLDAIFGFIILLAIIGAWIALLMTGAGHEAYMRELYARSIHVEFTPQLKWFVAIAAGILGTLPWILMIFGVSWVRVLAKSASTFSASRHTNGSALLWVSLTVAICLSLFIPEFHPAAVIIACLVACLLGRAFMKLPQAGNRFFFLLAAICVIVAGVIILMMSSESSQKLLLPLLPSVLPVADIGKKLLTLSTLPIIGGIVLVAGLIALYFVKRYRAAGGLLYAMLIVIILCQVARFKLVPELAAMPGTPLVTFEQVEKRVVSLVSAPALTPAASPEAAQPAAVKTPAQEPADENAAVPESAPSVPVEQGAPAYTPDTSSAPAPDAAASADQNADNGQTKEPAKEPVVIEQPDPPARDLLPTESDTSR